MKLRLSKKKFSQSTFVFIFMLFFSLHAAHSQNAIQLTNVQSGKKLKPIKTGVRLKYTIAPPQGQAVVAATGTLTALTPTTLTIGGQTINIQDIQKLGRQKKGSNFFGWALTTFGNITWIGALSSASRGSEVACANCHEFVEDDGGTEGTVFLTAVGLGATYLGIRTLIKNSQKDLVSKYKLNVVEIK